MPEEIKKVLLVALEGPSGTDLVTTAQAGEMPNLRQLMGEGATLAGMAAEASPAASWASLATGAHAVTHGVTGEGTSAAQPIWEAPGRPASGGCCWAIPRWDTP